VRKEEGSAEAASLERRRRPRTGRGRGGWEGGAEMHQRREGIPLSSNAKCLLCMHDLLESNSVMHNILGDA
jgi:hypothetical protein